jgi:hypothetical protein
MTPGRVRLWPAYDGQVPVNDEPAGSPVPVSRGIAMYPVVYWSGVTLFVVWSVFSAVSALHGF